MTVSVACRVGLTALLLTSAMGERPTSTGELTTDELTLLQTKSQTNVRLSEDPEGTLGGDSDGEDRPSGEKDLSVIAPKDLSSLRSMFKNLSLVNDATGETIFISLNQSVQSNRTRRTYPNPTLFSYPDGSSSYENYCASSSRYTLVGNGQTITAAGCRILSCEPMFYDYWCGPYFYTEAEPNNDDSYDDCKCCIGYSPTVYKSSVGNKIYT